MIKFITSLAHRYRHANWALFDQTMVSGANFLTAILLARYLGIDGYGRFVLAWMAIELVRIVLDPLIVSPMVVIGPKQPAEKSTLYYGTVSICQFILTLAGCVLLFVGVSVVNFAVPSWNLEGLPLVIAFAALAHILHHFIRRCAFTRQISKIAFFGDSVRYLGQISALIVLFQFYELDVAIALFVNSVTAMLAVLCSLPWFLPVRFDRETFRTLVRRHWSFSKWIVPSVLLDRATVDLLMATAGAVIGAGAVGIIRGTQNLVAVTHVILLGLENYVPIRAAQRFNEVGKAGLTKFLWRFSFIAGAAMTGVLIVLVIAPEFWLSLVYADQFKGYGYLVQWWALIYVVLFVLVPIHVGLRVLEYTRPMLINAIILAVMNIAICYPLISEFGIAGVMTGLTLIYVIRFLFLSYFFRRRLRITP